MANRNDPAHEATERLIQEMERELAKEYAQAYKDLSKKLDDYLKAFATKDAIWQRWVAEGKKTEAEYKKWRMGQLAVGKRWSEMKQTLAQDLHNVNRIARSIVNGYMPEVYALNHDYATFEAEYYSGINTSYTLYDRDTVERMFRENPELMPGYLPNSEVARNIAAGRDIAWNRQKIQSAMVQGILQGESIDKMANRIMKVTTADYNAAVRYARTMSTNAQNAGRYAGYERAEEKGIPLSLVWTATLDERTRYSHRQLDGQRRNVGQPFEVDGVKIMYPADLGGKNYKVPGSMIWNCRCTIIAQVKGFEYDVHTNRTDYSQIEGDYDTWKNNHKSKPNPIDLPKRKADAIRGSYISKYAGFPVSPDSSSNGAANLARRLSNSELFFSTVDGRANPQKLDVIKPRNLIKDMNKTDAGKKALSLISDNSTDVELCYGVDNMGVDGSILLGVYDPIDNRIRIFADETKTIKETAAITVHEAFHIIYREPTQKSEVRCIMMETMHRNRTDKLNFSEIKAIIKQVKNDYSDLPWR